MRDVWALAIALAACADPAPPSPREIYDDLEARITIDCGSYENNASFDDDGPPAYLCGTQPDVACINDAIGGAAIAHLKYASVDPATLLYREQNYYAGDGKLVWVGFFDVSGRGPTWHVAQCHELVATSVNGPQESCWKLLATDCHH